MAPKLIVICGPTATGKTKLGVALAQRLGRGGLRRLYAGLRDMAIGTAQPTPEGEMAGVPHHMMGWWIPRKLQRGPVRPGGHGLGGGYPPPGQAAHPGGGGTGLYIDGPCQGRTYSDFQPTSGLRQAPQARVQSQGLAVLWQELEQVDPETAAKLHPHDEKRILRALEVWHTTGKPISQHNRETQALPPRYEKVGHRPDLPGPAGPLPTHRPAGGPDGGPGAGGGGPGPLDAGVPLDGTAMQAIGSRELAGPSPKGGIWPRRWRRSSAVPASTPSGSSPGSAGTPI